MIITVTAVLSKIQDLPEDFRNYVEQVTPGVANVRSWTRDAVYTVSLRAGKTEGNLDATCACPATKLCKHIVAYYAWAKGLVPAKDEEISTDVETVPAEALTPDTEQIRVRVSISNDPLCSDEARYGAIIAPTIRDHFFDLEIPALPVGWTIREIVLISDSESKEGGDQHAK